MVTHSFNPNTRRLRQKDEFKASLSLVYKWVSGQPRLHRNRLEKPAKNTKQNPHLIGIRAAKHNDLSWMSVTHSWKNRCCLTSKTNASRKNSKKIYKEKKTKEALSVLQGSGSQSHTAQSPETEPAQPHGSLPRWALAQPPGRPIRRRQVASSCGR